MHFPLFLKSPVDSFISTRDTQQKNASPWWSTQSDRSQGLAKAWSFSDPYFIVTGASQGLGKSLALELAAGGYHLVLLSLAGESLEVLSSQIRESSKVNVFVYETDLTRENSVHEFYDWIKKRNLKISGLINNAGIGGTMDFTGSSPERLSHMIMLNIRATTLLSRLLMPDLMKNRKAYVLNVSSMAGFYPIPYKCVYAASKAYIYSFSLSLSEELRGTAIHVSVLHPGPMVTTADIAARLEKHNWLAKKTVLPVQEVARIALKSMFRHRPVIIPGLLNRICYRIMQLLPSGYILPVLSKNMAKEIA